MRSVTKMPSIISKKKTLTRRMTMGKISLDTEIEAAYHIVSQIDNNQGKVLKWFHNNEKIFSYIQYMMTKINKSQIDIEFMKLYFNCLDKFKNVFASSGISFNELMNRICLQLKCEQYNTNEIVCRQGDKGDKFFIILKGTVSVIITHEEIVKMNKVDYLKYLIMLCFYKEKALLTKTLKINNVIYNIDEKDIYGLLYVFYFFKLSKQFGLVKQDFRMISLFLDNKKDIYHYIYTILNEAPESFLGILELQETKIMEVYQYFNYLYEKHIQTNYNFDCLGDNEQYVQHVMTSINNIINSSHPFVVTVPIEDYCERINNLEHLKGEKGIAVKVYKYSEVTTLSEGEIFGDIALRNTQKKRTASIITINDCVFGTLTQAAYDQCFKGTQEKIRNLNCFFFINGPIFKHIKQNLFEKKYYNYFALMESSIGHKLISQNEKMKSIYFIKKGEIEISTQMTYNQLNDFIIKLGGKFDNQKYKHLVNEFKDFKDNISKRKITWKICVLKENEVAGLNDIILDNKYICDCICSSKKVILFSLEENFLSLMQEDKQIETNIVEYVNIKRKVLIDRLINLSDSFLSSYVSKMKNEIPLQEKKDNSISKSRLVYMNGTIHAESIRMLKTKRKIKIANTEPSSMSKFPNIKMTSISGNNSRCNIRYNKSESYYSQRRASSLKNTFDNCSSSQSLVKIENNKQTSFIKNSSFNNNYSVSDGNKAYTISLRKKLISEMPIEEEICKETYKVMNTSYLKTTRTRKCFFIPKRGAIVNALKETKINFVENKTVTNNEFFMKHPHLFDNIINPNTKRNNDGFIDCLVLDKYLEKRTKEKRNNANKGNFL